MYLSRTSFDLKIILLPAVLLIYIWLVWPALSGPFVFDDFPNLQNMAVLNNGLSFQSLGIYLESFTGSPGRPISALSFLINDIAWQSEPYSFKYTNLMIHLLNGVLLFGLLRQLAKACPELPQSPHWPLLAMAVWLFHPLQLSAQMLVVQRMTLLSATFCFIGLWGYIALLQRAKSALGAFAALSVLGACTILAFLSKENGALLPLFAWVLNATLLHKILKEKDMQSRRLLQLGVILPSVLLFAGIIYMAIQPSAFASRQFNMIERLMTQTHVLTDYLRHIIMPRLSGSGIYFDDYPITRAWTQPISTLFLVLGFLISLIFAIAKRHKFPVLSFAILWFFAGHAMESTVLDLELYFEHRNYLPLLGPALLISALPFLQESRRQLGLTLYAIWLGLLITITALQAPVWGDARMMTTLWSVERPLSLRAAQELAKYQYDNNQPQAAVDTLMGAYARGVKYSDLPLNSLLAKCWRPEIQARKDLFQEGLRSARSSPYSNSALKTLLLLRQATQENICPTTINSHQWLNLSDAFLVNPKFHKVAESHIRVERAKFFIHQRNLDLTMGELERAYAINPTVELSQKIAEVLLSAGLNDEANYWLEEGLKVRQPMFDSIMYDPKEKSIELRETILKLKKTQD